MERVAGLEAQRGPGTGSPVLVASIRVVRLRMMFAVIIGTAIALLPLFGPHRLLIGIGVAAIELAVDAHALQVLRRDGAPLWTMALADAVLAVVVVAAVPESMAIAAIVCASVTSLNVFWFGPVRTLATAAVFQAGLLAVGLTERPHWWVAVLIAFPLCVIAVTTALQNIARAAADTRRRFDALVNGVDAVVWESDADDHTTFVSGNVEEVLGSTVEAFSLPTFWDERVHPEDADAMRQSRHHNAEGRSTEHHLRVLDDRGAYRRIQERIKVSVAADGSVRRRRGLVMDETRRWEAEADVRRYSDFIQGIPIALIILRLPDRDDPRSLELVALNPAAQQLFGTPEPGGRVRVVDQIAISAPWLARLAGVAGRTTALERPFVDVPGSDGVFALRAVPLPDDHIGVSLEDVTKRARLAESFRHQAMHDPLTGLANRAQLLARLDEVLDAADEDEPNAPVVALLLVDLDQFKEVNDALGHEYGDRLLTGFAHRLSENLRSCDLVARLGGDEFAVLVTDNASEDEALQIASRLLELCETKFQVGEYRFQIGASVGIAVAPQHGDEAETLLRQADAAMYRAKASGGGAALCSPGQELFNVRRLELMGELREAIRSDAMEVHYQPRIDLRTHRTIGLEALVRWRHPRHGLLPPLEFIELAEVSGAIGELTHHVGERAAQEIDDLLGEHDLTLSVNLSSRTLYDVRLLEWVEELMERRRGASGRLCFDITETQLMDDPGRSLAVLHDLCRTGVLLSVDDFGTGNSSLAYLRDLPIDEIKIDRTFVADVRRDETILRSAIDLGHNLGLHVVGEGVEDADTERLLRTMGCDSAQGFRWGAAMPAVALAAHLTGAWEHTISL